MISPSMSSLPCNAWRSRLSCATRGGARGATAVGRLHESLLWRGSSASDGAASRSASIPRDARRRHRRRAHAICQLSANLRMCASAIRSRSYARASRGDLPLQRDLQVADLQPWSRSSLRAGTARLTARCTRPFGRPHLRSCRRARPCGGSSGARTAAACSWPPKIWRGVRSSFASVHRWSHRSSTPAMPQTVARRRPWLRRCSRCPRRPRRSSARRHTSPTRRRRPR